MRSFDGTSKRLEVEPVSESVNLDTHAFVVVVVGLFMVLTICLLGGGGAHVQPT